MTKVSPFPQQLITQSLVSFAVQRLTACLLPNDIPVIDAKCPQGYQLPI